MKNPLKGVSLTFKKCLESLKYKKDKHFLGLCLKHRDKLEKLFLYPEFLDVASIFKAGTDQGYEHENWLRPNGKTLALKDNYASISRHAAKYFSGVKLDDKSHKDHRLHAAWRLLASYTRDQRGIIHPDDLINNVLQVTNSSTKNDGLTTLGINKYGFPYEIIGGERLAAVEGQRRIDPNPLIQYDHTGQQYYKPGGFVKVESQIPEKRNLFKEIKQGIFDIKNKLAQSQQVNVGNYLVPYPKSYKEFAESFPGLEPTLKEKRNYESRETDLDDSNCLSIEKVTKKYKDSPYYYTTTSKKGKKNV